MQHGGNTNTGNTARKFYLNAKTSAEILDLPVRLLRQTWHLLVALNQTHSFPSIEEYKRRAAKAHKLYRKSLGSSKQMSAVVHVIYAHGADYLEWAETVVGVPLGALSDGGTEAGNKTKKHHKHFHARRDSVVHSSWDAFHATMWRSDPLVLSFWECIQTVKRGHVRKPKSGQKPRI